MVRSTLAILALVMSTGCAGSNSSLVRGQGWSFQSPDKGWWFIHRGYWAGTVAVGSSRYNVGDRPMDVSLTRGCDKEHHDSYQQGVVLGRATKYVGGRLGTLAAERVEGTYRGDKSSTVVYTASVVQDRCVWTLTCSGDARRESYVNSVCTSMMASLEFHE